MRIRQRIPHTGLGREVNYRVGTNRFEESRNAFSICDVELVELESFVAG